MANISFSSKLYDAVNNYYQYNPDTLMPLLMLALAAQNKLQISMSSNNGHAIVCSLKPLEIIDYEWVRLNPLLRKRMKQAINEGCSSINVEACIDVSLQDIYDVFYHYDTYTVEEEYHHRIGILYHHSSNEASEQAHRQYATFCLAESLINAPNEWLKKRFLVIANHILVKSGLQPERPRLEVAQALCALLQYDGVGTVYNPFAGCAIAAAMLQAGDNLYADGNSNDKLFSAARLLLYGMGGSNLHTEQRDSTHWIKDNQKVDFVLSTYRGYVEGKSAFDFCLSKCFNGLNPGGRYAGIISPKDIFEKQSGEMKEALRRDWVDTIALLPFGEVAVLINTRKSTSLKHKVRFYNLTHPMLRNRPMSQILMDGSYAEIIRVADVKKKGYLCNLVTPEIGEREGYEIVRLGDLVKKLQRRTYSLSHIPEEGRVLAYVNRKETYNRYNRAWMNGLEKFPITSLFAPAYHLTSDCLITNQRGELEPRLFDADRGTAFFQDGFAFEICNQIDFNWLMEELNEPYVRRQLHPYGMDVLIPESMTEERILDLKLYRFIEDDELFECSEDDKSEDDKLPTGYQLLGENTQYTIHTFLGNGYFGYTYSALAHNLVTGEKKEVVLKEFFPYRYYHRENGFMAVLNEDCSESLMEDNLAKFKEEALIMKRLGNRPDSHIVPAYEFFNNEQTNTCYYVMPFYPNGSLEKLQETGFSFTEELVINQIVKPLCKALHIAHEAKVLHLDIKPENILVDNEGNAVLIDFGVAKQYSKEGIIIDEKGLSSRSVFAAPELKTEGAMVRFGAQTDIYGLAASIFYLIAFPADPHPIMDFSNQDWDIRECLKHAHCSPQFIDAIIRGLQHSAVARPASAQAFLQLFPGCEKIEL